jgi:MobA/MobL family.
MAIYHCSIKTISRSKGQNAIAAGAYRAGEKLISQRTGEIFDYRRKSGIIHKEIIVAPGLACLTRNQLWNLAESSETRCNSTVAREYEVALPSELNNMAKLSLVREFAAHLVSAYGVAADLALHAPGRHGDSRNHHAHILTTTRVMTESGLGAKTRVLDDRKTGEVERLRERWAQLVNDALGRAGLNARVSHKSLAAQGSDCHPTIHLGPAAAAMERRGEASDRGDVNRAVSEHNFHLAQAEALNRRLKELRADQNQFSMDSAGNLGGWSLAGLAKKGLQGLTELWSKGRNPEDPPYDKKAKPLEPAHVSPAVPLMTPAESPSALLEKASQAATRLKAWGEATQKHQAEWSASLKNLEALAQAGEESSALDVLNQVKDQVNKTLPLVQITKIQEFISTQAEKVRSAAPSDGEEVSVEHANKIDKMARQARYNLLVMRSVWSGKIDAANDILLKEAKLSTWAKDVVQAAGANYEKARGLLAHVEKAGRALKSFAQGETSAPSVKAAADLLAKVRVELPQEADKVHERSQEIWRDIRKLRNYAVDRDRLSEAARQSAELAGLAGSTVTQVKRHLRELSIDSKDLEAQHSEMEEKQEKKPELRRHRPRGHGR